MTKIDKPKIALVVSGMHRSGTSSVAGTLALLGASLPRTLMPSSPENPRGYFESAAIADFNDRILSDCGSSWKDWRAVQNAWATNPKLAGYLAAAKDLLDSEYGPSGFIVLKDPRIPRILPLWTRALDEAGYQCMHVVPLRHPDSVASSLQGRTYFGKATAHMLWLRHLVDAELYSRGQKRVFLSWYDFLADWEGQAIRISTILGFSWPRLNDRSRAEVADFLSAELQHHREPARFGEGRLVANEYVRRAYKAAAATIGDPNSQVALRELDALYGELSHTEGIYGPLLADHQLTAKRLVSDFFGQQEVSDEWHAPANDMETLLGAAAREHAKAVGRAQVLAEELQQSRTQADQLKAELTDELVRSHEHAESLRKRVSQLESLRAAESVGRDAMNLQIAEVTEERDRLRALAGSLQARVSELESAREVAAAERDTMSRQVVQVTDEIARLGEECRLAKRNLDSSVEHLSRVSDARKVAELKLRNTEGSLGAAVARARRFEVEAARIKKHPILRYFYRELDESCMTGAPAGELTLAADASGQAGGGKVEAPFADSSPELGSEVAAGLRLDDDASPVEEGGSAPRILVMDYRVPMPDISAGEKATVGILGDLRTFGYEVVFLPNGMEPSPEYEAPLQALGVRTVTRRDGYSSSTDYIARKGHRFDAFYLVRVDVVESMIDKIREVAPTARVIFHAPDVYFLREGREAKLRNDDNMAARANQTRDRELAVIRRVDHTVIVSPAELPILRRYVPDSPISVFPVLYAEVVDDTPRMADRRDIFFLGGFAHTPNVDAVCWFASEIWPLVRDRLPGVRFRIFGSEAPPAVVDLAGEAGVVVDGYVKDLMAVLPQLRLGVAPIRFGAGIKGKVATTLGAGIPCVCTSIAAEGMGIRDRVHGRIADEPGKFADAIVDIYTDAEQWEQYANSGRELVRNRFGFDANRGSLLQALNDARAFPLEKYIAYCQALEPCAIPYAGQSRALDVSIIVPVYNQWQLTRACISSIIESCRGDETSYEIILADDGSSDETIRAGRAFPGLRVVKTAQNVGFLRNCNNAAKAAKGRHILLLNNDTIVLPRGLSSLVQLIDQDESAAIVGSKLLYPDGTIQEAGAVLFSDATAINYARGRPRDVPEIRSVREADYISGCSILIRRTFWEEVGGFDERYETAYCEDSDLAMTARSRGLRVLYQPESEVVHFESKSYTGERTALQQRNIARLKAKWATEFATQHLPAGSPEYLGVALAQRAPSHAALQRRQRGNLNILYFSPFPSHPASHGNRASIQKLARIFQDMGHRVHFVLLSNQAESPQSVNQMRSAWDSLDLVPFSNPLVADGKPIPMDGWYEAGLGEKIAALCLQYDIDVVFCSYIFQSRMLEYVPAHILKVIDTHDRMGDRYEMLRMHGLPLEFFSCSPEQEGEYLRRADVVVARRQEEANYFNGVSGNKNAVVIPHVEDPNFLSRQWDRIRIVGIVASANRINLAIVREFAMSVRKHARDVPVPFELHVAGEVQAMLRELTAEDRILLESPWIHWLGFVPDIGEFYSSVDLVVSPVTLGTGINVKTVQAMAYGMPVLATAVGIKGIETGSRFHNHQDVDALVRTLFELVADPSELSALAELSRRTYTVFENGARKAITEALSRVHQKL